MKPIVRSLNDQAWEGWSDEQAAVRGKVMWKDLIGSDPNEGADTLMGVARLRQGETLEPHRHSLPETYFTLSGRGIVTIDGEKIALEPGTAVFIPGDAVHQLENANPEDLQVLYTFACNDWNKVIYRF